MKKNVRVKVRKYSCADLWDVGIFVGKRKIMASENSYFKKHHAIRKAKSVSERSGIPYSPEIIKKHGC